MATNPTVEPPADECPECGSTEREFIRAFSGDISEPPHGGGENCFDCGHEFEEPDQATRLGI